MLPPDYRYCSRCGQPLVEKEAFGRLRPVCEACGFVVFRDPKVAAAVLVTTDQRVLLVRRAAIPRLGFWALPAGFVDADEMPAETAVREVQEETGLDIAVDQLVGLQPMPNPDKLGFVIIYRGHVLGGNLQAQDDVSEARWFAPDEVPWDQLAFESTRRAVESWMSEQGDALRWSVKDAVRRPHGTPSSG